MKHLFIILILIAFQSEAQTHTIKRGSDGYVTIDGQNYQRGYLLTQYYYYSTDSVMGILYANTRTPLIMPTVDSNYLYADSANKRAYNMTVLKTWMNTNFEFFH